jgi:hypothetical protein
MLLAMRENFYYIMGCCMIQMSAGQRLTLPIRW